MHPNNTVCLILSDIEWPQDEEALSDEAVDAVEQFLTMDPKSRPTANAVQRMDFFKDIDWKTMQSIEPPFIPKPEDPTDTSYFEGILDRYVDLFGL